MVRLHSTDARARRTRRRAARAAGVRPRGRITTTGRTGMKRRQFLHTLGALGPTHALLASAPA
ncbi:hypothetical protein GA845_36190, partial [Burkholderia pseudomallei]|nr:hypothetical protein [Burkholderia pseudomallei]